MWCLASCLAFQCSAFHSCKRRIKGIICARRASLQGAWPVQSHRPASSFLEKPRGWGFMPSPWPYHHLEIRNDFICEVVFCKWNLMGQPVITSSAFRSSGRQPPPRILNSTQGGATGLQTRARSPGKPGQGREQAAGLGPSCSKLAVTAQSAWLTLANETVGPDGITKGSALLSGLRVFVARGFWVEASRWSSICGAKNDLWSNY